MRNEEGTVYQESSIQSEKIKKRMNGRSILHIMKK